MQQTLVLLKPDTVQRSLVGELIARLERKGLKITGMKLMQVTAELARLHYEAHEGKSFFPGLIEFITSSPIVAMVVEGNNTIDMVRHIMGTTNPQEATPGSVRGDYALTIGMNLMHGSDSDEAAQREISLFFSPDEIVEYNRAIDQWIIES